MSAYEKRLRGFQSAMGDSSSHKQILQNKLSEYKAVKQGTDAFNTANQMKNYIKDGIGTAKGVGTEVGISTAKKAIQGGVEGVFKLGDKIRGTKGAFSGTEDKAGNKAVGFAERQTNKMTDAIRSKYGLRKGVLKKATKGGEEAGEEAGEDAGEDAGEGALEGGAEAGTEALVEGGVEAGAEAGGELIGAEATELVAGSVAEIGLDLLDATGVGAIVGIPLQIATGVGMAMGGYELGKNLWNDMTDIFSHGGDKGDKATPVAPKIGRPSLMGATLET